MADVEYQREKPNDEDSGMNSCIGGLIWIISMILIICTFPFSLCVCVKMVQEYERAVIFRLGRVKKGLTTIAKSFYYVKYGSLIVTSKILSKILSNKNKKLVFLEK